MGLQDKNVCWKQVQHRYKIWDRFLGWKELCHISVAFNNQNYNSERYQPRGTALLSLKKTSRCFESSGCDEFQLDRWIWNRYHGRCGRFLRVFSFYIHAVVSVHHKKGRRNMSTRIILAGYSKIYSTMEISRG